MKQFLKSLCFLLISLFVICSADRGEAHEVRPTIFTLKLERSGTFELSADANLEALIAEIGPDHSDTETSPNAISYNRLRALPPARLTKEFRTFAADWLREIGLSFDGKVAVLTIESADIPEIGDIDLARQSFVVLAGSVPAGTSMLNWAYPAKFGSSVLRIERPGQEVQSKWYPAGVASEPIALSSEQRRGWFEIAIDYLVIGFTHIIPKGLDHILFVLGLFLLNQNWRPLIWQVTAFTLAHTVTLALGIYGIVDLSPSIVEPLIALSIVYVAVENVLTDTLHRWRPVIVFLFGLLHGLGFAGVLSEIGLQRGDFALSLITFNVGVELGQLAVIAIAFVALYAFMKKPWYRRVVVIPLSLAIAAMGAWWFVERTVL